MKKLSVWICTGMLLTCLAGCGSTGKEDNKDNSQADGSQTVTDQGGADAGGAQDDQGGADVGGSGSDGGEEMGTIANGHDYAEGWTEEMEAVKAAVTDVLGDDYWPNMPLMPDMMEMNYGLTEDMYEDYLAETPMIGTNVDTLIVVKPKAGKEAAVEERLTAYRNNAVNNSAQYPMNVGKVQASRVDKIGAYICFIQLGADTMDASDLGDEAVIEQCQKANEQAYAAIQAAQ